ncbi:MAG: helix-turn-helix transcriptional regulator [Solirubrobacteraceae bacterium]
MPSAPTPQRALGIAVARRRSELGLTQEQLSLRARLHQRWISNVETGKRNPSYASIRRLAAGLDLTASQLIGSAERIESTPTRSPS